MFLCCVYSDIVLSGRHAAIDRMSEIIHVELICEAGSCSLRLCTCCYQLLPLAVWTKLCCVFQCYSSHCQQCGPSDGGAGMGHTLWHT